MKRREAELAELRSITDVRISAVRFKPEDDEYPAAWVCIVRTPDGPVPMFVTPKVVGHTSNLLWLLRQYGRPPSRDLTADDRRRIRALLRAITDDARVPVSHG